MKKVLFIAYLYPPIANSGTQRSVQFANYLEDFGWAPIVLTVQNPPDTTIEPELVKEIHPKIRIERVPFLSDVVAQKISRIFRGVISDERMFEAVRWRIRNLWNFPDKCALWRPTAVSRALQIYQEEGFDCVYASGFPWTSFLVAKDISRKTGIPMILDYRDLWTGWVAGWDDSNSIIRWFRRRQELGVLKKTSAVITVTDSLVRVLENIVPVSFKKPVVCITNGFEPAHFKIAPSERCDTGKVRIVYTGVWKAGYSLDTLYQAVRVLQSDYLGLLDGLEIVCAGFTPGPAEQLGLESTIKELGKIPHASAISLMKSADVLFIHVPKGEYAVWSLPGKLFEYLGACKPIIAEVPDVSEVANVLNKTGGAVRIEPDDVGRMVEVLVGIVKAGGLDLVAPDASIVSKFERRNLTEKLAGVLESVTCFR